MYSVHLHCSAMRGQINSISKLTKRKFLLRIMVTVTIKKKKFREVLVLQRKRAIWGEIAGNNIHLISFWFHSVSTFSKKTFLKYSRSYNLFSLMSRQYFNTNGVSFVDAMFLLRKILMQPLKGP